MWKGRRIRIGSAAFLTRIKASTLSRPTKWWEAAAVNPAASPIEPLRLHPPPARRFQPCRNQLSH